MLVVEVAWRVAGLQFVGPSSLASACRGSVKSETRFRFCRWRWSNCRNSRIQDTGHLAGFSEAPEPWCTTLYLSPGSVRLIHRSPAAVEASLSGTTCELNTERTPVSCLSRTAVAFAAWWPCGSGMWRGPCPLARRAIPARRRNHLKCSNDPPGERWPRCLQAVGTRREASTTTCCRCRRVSGGHTHSSDASPHSQMRRCRR